jgi:hypothetical protein
VGNPELRTVIWDYAKLLELGVSQEFVERLNPRQAQELLKGILYIQAKFGDQRG